MEGKAPKKGVPVKQAGKGIAIRYATVESSLGPVLVAASGKGVCRLAFGEEESDLRAAFPAAEITRASKDDRDFADLLGRVVDAIERPNEAHNIRVDARGTAFQEGCWQALCGIPPGQTRSYGQLAAAIGKPNASRAVGGANGANPVAVLIPCHRVIAADGSLGGYAYGAAIKRELLRREARS